MAFTLYKDCSGEIVPCPKQQVFVSLPLQAYGLKFVLQGIFLLSSFREVDNDNATECHELYANVAESIKSLHCYQSNRGAALIMVETKNDKLLQTLSVGFNRVRMVQ